MSAAGVGWYYSNIPSLYCMVLFALPRNDTIQKGEDSIKNMDLK